MSIKDVLIRVTRRWIPFGCGDDQPHDTVEEVAVPKGYIWTQTPLPYFNTEPGSLEYGESYPAQVGKYVPPRPVPPFLPGGLRDTRSLLPEPIRPCPRCTGEGRLMSMGIRTWSRCRMCRGRGHTQGYIARGLWGGQPWQVIGRPIPDGRWLAYVMAPKAGIIIDDIRVYVQEAEGLWYLVENPYNNAPIWDGPFTPEEFRDLILWVKPYALQLEAWDEPEGTCDHWGPIFWGPDARLPRGLCQVEAWRKARRKI